MRELSEQERVRREKLDEISKVCNPYPAKYDLAKAWILMEQQTLIQIGV